MECVDGVTIKDLLHESGGLPADVALDIADQVVAGLTAIHDAGIMHRDVKPSNLMRTRAGVVKLMDFGIAKQIGGVTLTAAGQAVGTPEYMSPEQLTGRKLDLRTDVYTTGIVLFELLTGVSPFHAETRRSQTAHKQVTEMPDFETPGIPATLVPCLRRALAKDREERFGSARELGEALARARRGLDLPFVRPRRDGPPGIAAPPEAPAAPPPPAPSPRPPARSRPSTAQSQAMMLPPVTAVIELLRGPDPTAKRQAVLSTRRAGPPARRRRCGRWPTPSRTPTGAYGSWPRQPSGGSGPAAEAAVPALLRALADEAAGNEAAESLVKIGKAAVPTLLEVMKSGHSALSTQAADTLTRIGARLEKPRSE